MAPRQRHIMQQPSQDEMSASLVIDTTSEATLSDDDDVDDMTIDHNAINKSKPFVTGEIKSLIETPAHQTYNADESYAKAELARDRHDIFNVVALVRCCEHIKIESHVCKEHAL
jgi:hypothetical protein